MTMLEGTRVEQLPGGGYRITMWATATPPDGEAWSKQWHWLTVDSGPVGRRTVEILFPELLQAIEHVLDK
jgi:hypothetical protein